MRLVALDLGLRNTGLAVFQDRQPIALQSFTALAPDLFGPKIFAEHADWLETIIALYQPEAFSLESPAIGAKQLCSSIGGLYYLYLLRIYKSNLPCIVSPPPRWKKFVTGNGMAKKPDIKSAILKLYNFKKKYTQDVYDAAGVGTFAATCLAQKYNQNPSLTKIQAELVYTTPESTLRNSNLHFNL